MALQSLFQNDLSLSGSALAASIARPTPKGHLDELRGKDPALTEYWARFFDLLGPEGIADLNRRQQGMVRQLHDNGVTYNVYADAEGTPRPWSLDLFPLIIPAQDWATIEAGVTQRARLLNRILADIYGPRQLLEQALLPAALVQGHPGYLRAMQGAQPAGGTWLHIAAFDLAHGPDGRWWIVSHRTQAPSGLGYLLENRITISREFPAAFNAMKVQRLAGSYKALMRGLQTLSPKGANARIALLTPGPYNETYFEHAYLARYLGLSLVEGHDLTVRDQHVYLKTMDGLEPVDVLIKRLDDQWLDPLELRPDSALGVPGLMQAVQAGNVLLANAPGSAPLESSAMLGFLPAICEHLLSEPLKLPSLDTWWCGEAATLENALPMLHKSVIKNNYSGKFSQTLIGPTLDAVSLEKLARRIVHRPDEHTLQAYLPLSHNPTWHDGNIAPRATMLRVFALADGPDSWRVLPGGIVRLAPQGQMIASMQRGGSSADCWVLSDGEPDDTSLLRQASSTLTLAQQKRVVTSRSAENLFWLGRYTERAENTVRQARLTLRTLLSDDANDARLSAWLGQLALAQGLVMPQTPPPSQSSRVFERSLVAMLDADSGAHSVGYNLRALHQSANQVRERLSQELRNLIGRVDENFTAQQARLGEDSEYATQEALESLAAASESLAAITGAQTDRMVRDNGWRMLSIGRHLERLQTLAQALRLALETGSVFDDQGYETLLSLFDSSITFHAQYQQRRDLVALLDMLVINQDNPRSLGWVLKSLRARVIKLPQQNSDAPELLDLLPDPQSWDLATLSGAVASNESAAQNLTREALPAPAELMALLNSLEQAAADLSDKMTQRYFSHAERIKQSLFS